MESTSLRVVKFGGSLISWPPARERLTRWLSRQSNVRTIIFPGGGKLVDQIRDQHSKGMFGEKEAHFKAIASLKVNCERVTNWFPQAVQLNCPQRVRKTLHSLVIFDCSQWAATLDVPKSWDVTSDSLAAILASETRADQLILLKSRSPTSRNFVQDETLVDSLFWSYAQTPVDIVNLRDDFSLSSP